MSLLQDKAIHLHLNQAAVCLPATEMVGKRDFHDRTAGPHHNILPDKPDIAARINCSHSSVTGAEAFISNVFSLLGGRRVMVCSCCNGSVKGVSSTNMLY